jgi:hypothetical protein
MHVKLRNLVTFTHQPEKLPLGCCQRGIGHHVQQAYVQLTDILMGSTVRIKDRFALLLKSLKSG